MTATYSGAEVVTYHWNLNNAPITGAGGRTYSPSEAGSYTVTVSADGYKPKTSAAVAVTGAPLLPLGGIFRITAGGVEVSNVNTGTEVTAFYANASTVPGGVNYQWNRNAVPINNTTGWSATFTPTEGGIYTVTISADGYVSRTSEELTINLSGDISIALRASDPFNGAVHIDATYSGTETVIYQWKKDGTNVGTNAATHSPAATGAYTVTVSAEGFNSKTSTPVNAYGMPLTSTAEVSAYLAGLDAYLTELGVSGFRGATAADPTPLPVNIDLGTTNDANGGWATLLAAIGTAGKYVALDLSASAMTGTAFANPAAAAGKSLIVSLRLPDAAQSIADGAFVANGATFRGYTSLQEVSNVERIGKCAFLSMSTLTSISFPDASAIDEDAFNGCTALTTISFPEATTIGNTAFQSCTSLATASFPKATTIGGSAFSGCTALTTISFPVVTTIGNFAFQNSNALTSITIAASVDFDPFNDSYLPAAFVTYYNTTTGGNQRAGTYVLSGGNWTGPN